MLAVAVETKEPLAHGEEGRDFPIPPRRAPMPWKNRPFESFAKHHFVSSDGSLRPMDGSSEARMAAAERKLSRIRDQIRPLKRKVRSLNRKVSQEAKARGRTPELLEMRKKIERLQVRLKDLLKREGEMVEKIRKERS